MSDDLSTNVIRVSFDKGESAWAKYHEEEKIVYDYTKSMLTLTHFESEQHPSYELLFGHRCADGHEFPMAVNKISGVHLIRGGLHVEERILNVETDGEISLFRASNEDMVKLLFLVTSLWLDDKGVSAKEYVTAEMPSPDMIHMRREVDGDQ